MCRLILFHPQLHSNSPCSSSGWPQFLHPAHQHHRSRPLRLLLAKNVPHGRPNSTWHSDSSDGLLTISNPAETDEGEVMYTSARGALAQAGWYCSSANISSFGVWAASDMETFSLWSDDVCHLVWDQFTIWFSQARSVAVIWHSLSLCPCTVSDLGNGLSHYVSTSPRRFEIIYGI